MMSVRTLLEALGGPAAVARHCGVSTSAAWNWGARDGIAAQHQITVWRLAKQAGVEWAPPNSDGVTLVIDEAA